MRADRRQTFINYGTAVLAVGLALVCTLLLWRFINPLFAPLFLVAIIISAWRGGRGPGLVATAMSSLLSDYVFIAPRYQFSAALTDLKRLSVVLIMGFVLSWLIDLRRRSEVELRRSREELRHLAGHRQAIAEDTRARIARAVHDELGQELTALKFDISWLRERSLKACSEAESLLLAERFGTALKSIDEALSSVRRIATDLRPPVLDSLGLAAAVEWQTTEFEQRTGIRCRLTSLDEDLPLQRDGATAVFRILQESLTNIARHASATEVKVRLERRNDHLLLWVDDNGRGIDAETISETRSLGILGMKERVRLLQGEMTIEGRAGAGSSIRIDVPVEVDAAASVGRGAI